MAKYAVFINLSNNKKACRLIPISFEHYWKVGDVIYDETGENKCRITDILDEFDSAEELNRIQKEIENELQLEEKLKPKYYFKDRPSISRKLKYIIKNANEKEIIDYFNAANVTKYDFTYRNLICCYTRLILNDRYKIFCRVVPLREDNILNLEYVSNYIEDEILTVDVEFSIFHQGYSFEIQDNSVIIYNNKTPCTLRIIHDLSFWDIINIISKYKRIFGD